MKKKISKRNRKKKKKLLTILKDYAGVITIGVSVIAGILNLVMNYFEKASSTEFYIQYLTVKIDNKNWLNEGEDKITTSTNLSILKTPTLNNELNQLLYKHKDKVMNYFITYLIIRQRGKNDALDVKINFDQYGKTSSLNDKTLKEIPVDEKIFKKITKTIEYPFPKGEELKIPISICTLENTYSAHPKECYYIKLNPTSIEYKNKYLFSKRKIPIREYLEHDVIIDGEVITGKGGTPIEEETKKWYLK